MTTTTDSLPMRPRGAHRHAAAPLGARPVVAAPGRAGAPASGDAHEGTAPFTSRRARRAAERAAATAPQGAARLLTQALSLPVRTLADAAMTARALPVTATAVVACLFVTVATPQTATAATVGPPAPALDVQEFVVADGATLPVERDAFTIGRVPPKPAPAGPASPGAATPAPQGKPSARPVAGTVPTAGGFGARWVAGCAACSTNHQGLDFAAATGTPVSAAMTGRVVSAGVLGGYGNQVLLQHADGTRTRYGHLSQIGVSVGQSVTAGQRIGAVGNTGVSTGSHLHFEVIVGGIPVDPARWLQERGLL